jgi:hypothetical protein
VLARFNRGAQVNGTEARRRGTTTSTPDAMTLVASSPTNMFSGLTFTFSAPASAATAFVIGKVRSQKHRRRRKARRWGRPAGLSGAHRCRVRATDHADLIVSPGDAAEDLVPKIAGAAKTAAAVAEVFRNSRREARLSSLMFMM